MTEKEKENLRNLLTNLKGTFEMLEELLQEDENSENCMDVSENHSTEGNWTLERDISNILLELGIPISITGFQYIHTAVSILVKKEVLQKSYKLYSELADIYKTSPSSIERAIRYAKNIVWSNGNSLLIGKIFKEVDVDKVPTNRVFLYTLTDYIKSNKSVN